MSRRFKIILTTLLLFVLGVVGLVGCQEEDQTLRNALDSLEIGFSGSDTLINVTGDLQLPSSVGEVTITWESSNDAVISNSGKVVRPSADTEVTLTATLTYKDKSETLKFKVTVKAAAAGDTVKPIIMGVADVTIFQGDQFDPREGVTASDNVDGNITNKIEIVGTVDINTVGEYELTYKVKDAAGNEAIKRRMVYVVEKQECDLFLVNNNFSQPLEGTWGHWTGNGGASTISIEEGMLKYNVTANGTDWYSSQVYQAGLTVTKGKTYILTFDAKATVARNVRIKIETNGEPYTTYMDFIFKVEPTLKSFSHEFKVTLPTLTNGKFIIGIGNMTAFTGDEPVSTVYFDNFKFVEVDTGPDVTPPVLKGVEDKTINVNVPFSPLDGVTVSDDVDDLTVDDINVEGTVDVTKPGTYTLVYSVSDKTGNTTEVTRVITVTSDLIPSNLVIINGDFSEAQEAAIPQPATTGWGWHGAGTFSVSIPGGSDGCATIDITALGTVAWGVQFYQQNRIVDNGFIYEIKFRAKADTPRPIMFALEAGTNRQYDEIINITDSWEEYTIIYKHEKASFTNGKFAFFMGLVGDNSVPTKVYLDDITVETVAEFKDETDPQMFGMNDVVILKDVAFDPKAGVQLYDNYDKALTWEDNVVITGEVKVSIVGEYELEYKITDNAGNSNSYTRNVKVVEASGLYANTFGLVNGDFSEAQEQPKGEPPSPEAGTGWSWKTRDGGAATVAIAGGENGKAVIDVTAIGTLPHSIQFFQQNRHVEAAGIYKLSFKLSATEATAIRLSLEEGTNVKWYQVIDVQVAEKEYVFYMTNPGRGFKNGKLGFFLGKASENSKPSKFTLDDVKVELVGHLWDTDLPIILGNVPLEVGVGLQVDATSGLTIYDMSDMYVSAETAVVTPPAGFNETIPGDYEFIVKVTDRAGNYTEITREVKVLGGLLPSRIDIKNADFSIEQTAPVGQPAETGWGWHAGWNSGAQFNVSIPGGADGCATIEVIKPGNVVHGVQFYQQNKVVDQGSIYKITFRAKADVPRQIMFALESGTNRQYDEIFMLTTEWAEYTIIYHHEKASFTNGKFAFFLGMVGKEAVDGASVYLDDIEIVTIEEFVDATKPQLFNVGDTTIAKGVPFDPQVGVEIYDNHDKDLTWEANVLVTSEVNFGVVGVYDVEYKVTDKAGNSQTYLRKVKVVEPTDLYENTFGLVNGDFSVAQEGPVGQPAETGWGWHVGYNSGGVFTVSIPGGVDGAATIDVTNIGNVAHAVQFYQQNRHVEAYGIYKLTFKMNSTKATAIRLSLESGTIVKWFKIINVEATEKLYTVYMTNPGGGFKNAKLGFFLGKANENSQASTFTIDDVKVELIGHAFDTDLPVILNNKPLEIELGAIEVDPLAGLAALDQSDIYVDISKVVVTPPADFDITEPGEYDFVLKLTDRAGNVLETVRKVIVPGGLLPSRLDIKNANFDIDQLVPVPQRAETGWGWHGSGKFNVKIEGGMAVIEVQDSWIEWYGVQFYQQNKILDEGSIYEITFRAKALDPRTMRFAFENQTPGPAFSYFQEVLLTTDWVTYKVIYKHEKPTYNNVKLGFYLGKLDGSSIPTTVYIDDLEIKTIEAVYDDIAPIIFGAHDITVEQNGYFTEKEGLKVWDNADTTLTLADVVVEGNFDITTLGSYPLTYKVTDASGNVGTYTRTIKVIEGADFEFVEVPIANGDFSVEQTEPMTQPATTAWGWHGAGTFTVSIPGGVDGVATIDVTNPGTVPHGVQFYQQNKTIIADGIYRFNFKMKASVARSIRLSLEAGTNLRDYAIVDITTEWVEYSITMRPVGASFTNAKVAFFLGYIDETSVPATFYIDDVFFELIGYREDVLAPTISGIKDVEIKVGQAFDPLAGVNVHDYHDLSVVKGDIVVDGTVDTNTIGVYTLTYKIKDSKGNERVYTRIVTVVAAE